MLSNNEQLKRDISALMKLLDDPHPGLATWGACYATAASAVTDFLIGDALPDAWKQAINTGWRIVPCACGCGGSFAWMKPRRSGAAEMFGCVCHTIPTP